MSKPQTATAVVFDPHPDDADWWTGGLAMLLAKAQWQVHFVCVGPTEDKMREEALESAAILGIRRKFLEIPVTNNEHFAGDLADAIRSLLRELAPTAVFIPSLTDYHLEHVTLSRQLLRCFHWSSAAGLEDFEVYAYDSHVNRDPIEIYVDISSVWDRHVESLRCHRYFERPGLPDNALIRTKTGRAVMLGAALPAQPVLYAEGYRLLRGHPTRISSLPDVLAGKFYYRSDRELLALDSA